MCKKLIYLISVLVLAFCLMPSVQAANITLVTEDHDDDADGVQDDQQLVDWLEAEGHVVDVQRNYWVAFARTTVAELNTADLIIISRSTSSGNYADEDEPTKWNSLTTPLINLSAYLVRNSRWLWIDSGTALGEGGAPALEAVDPETIVGVLLTGMGNDGAHAMRELRVRGGYTIAESQETAMIFGMPRELVCLDGADLVLHNTRIADQLVAWTGQS